MAEIQSEILEGLVERVTFHSEESGYTVLKLRAKGQQDLIPVIGKMALPYAGESLRLRGSWGQHPKFGLQFQAQTCEKLMPATVNGLQKYLASGLIKGVGPVTSRRMVEAFGVDIIEVIESQPQRLLEIPLIGPKKRDLIVKSWDEHREIKNIMVFLQQYSVSTAYAVKIFKAYGNAAIEQVQTNPYQLAEDIWGIGFKTADKLGQALGLAGEHPARLEAGLRYALQKATETGHVFLPQNELFTQTSELLEVPSESLPTALEAMAKADQLILERDPTNPDVFLTTLWHAEEGIVKTLLGLLGKAESIDEQNLNNWLIAYQDKHQLQFSPEQISAVKAAASQPLFILTGGPGTGKTTVSRAILDWFCAQKLEILLGSPTGRAAKRLSEVSGREAKTLHRLLEFDPRKLKFKRNPEYPLKTDVLLLDEVSMIDTVLFYQVLKALPPNCRLVLVGDSHQLPSVGPGAILADLLASRKIPAVALQTIFRQAESSRIITNAHAVNQGKMPVLLPPLGKHRQEDAFFIEADTPEILEAELLALVSQRLPQAGYALEELQILCPMRRGTLGTIRLNAILQAALNPPEPKKQELTKRTRILREGDRVIQLRNNYDHGVYNGDLGVVQTIDPEAQEIQVTYPEQTVSYDFSEQDELDLAYALSIHKSQGSEFPVILLMMSMQHYLMLQRNLLYTGMTRAKRLLIILGQPKALALAVKNQQQRPRYTRLKERLLESDK